MRRPHRRKLGHVHALGDEGRLRPGGGHRQRSVRNGPHRAGSGPGAQRTAGGRIGQNPRSRDDGGTASVVDGRRTSARGAALAKAWTTLQRSLTKPRVGDRNRGFWYKTDEGGRMHESANPRFSEHFGEYGRRDFGSVA